MASKIYRSTILALAVLIFGCASWTYKSRNYSGSHGYMDFFFCGNTFAFDYMERIGIVETARNNVRRRMQEFLDFYDFENYEIIEPNDGRVSGNFIPYIGYSGSPPYAWAEIKVKVKGKPRKNNFYLRNETLRLYLQADRNQILDYFDPKQNKWVKFWDNRFLQIGDRIRSQVGFFDNRRDSGLFIRACFAKADNVSILTQDVEFVVAEDHLEFVKGGIYRCAQVSQNGAPEKPCAWPIGYNGKMSLFER